MRNLYAIEPREAGKGIGRLTPNPNTKEGNVKDNNTWKKQMKRIILYIPLVPCSNFFSYF